MNYGKHTMNNEKPTVDDTQINTDIDFHMYINIDNINIDTSRVSFDHASFNVLFYYIYFFTFKKERTTTHVIVI